MAQKINIILKVKNEENFRKRMAKAQAYIKQCLINKLPEEQRLAAAEMLVEHERERLGIK